MTDINIDFQIPEKLAPLMEPRRHKVLWGGRGSGKSINIAQMLVYQACTQKLRILCTREVQRSLRDSVHSTLRDVIEMMGVSELFDVTRESIRCLITGSEFIFSGLNQNTADSLKSIAGINIAWVEEASTVSQDSIDKLLPSIRAEGSEIWWSFNPHLASDPVYDKFITNIQRLDNAIVIKMNHEDNPFFPSVLKKEMEQCRDNDYEKYKNVWLGETIEHDNALIFAGKYTSYAFDPDPSWSVMYGCDLGFAQDPTVLVKCYADDDTLYVEHELYMVGLDIELMPAYFDTVPGAREHVIYVDCSRPETISHLKRNGYPRCQPVKKWPGSPKDGIERMRAFNQIVVHPRCTHVLDDLGCYSYKVDVRTNEILPDIDHKGSDSCDAIRYAIQPLILGWKKKISAREPDPKLNTIGMPIPGNARGKYDYIS